MCHLRPALESVTDIWWLANHAGIGAAVLAATSILAAQGIRG